MKSLWISHREVEFTPASLMADIIQCTLKLGYINSSLVEFLPNIYYDPESHAPEPWRKYEMANRVGAREKMWKIERESEEIISCLPKMLLNTIKANLDIISSNMNLLGILYNMYFSLITNFL